MPNENGVSNTQKKSKLKLNNRQILVVRLIAVIMLILLLLFMAAEMLNIASVSDVNDGIRNFVATLTPGGGYPYKINSSSVKHISVLNGNLFILTDEKTISLDSTAKQVKSTQHTYSSPDMRTRNGRAIVFNRNGNRYRVENRTDTLFTGETAQEEKIITCSIGAKGNIALATLCDKAKSKLTVVNSNYKREVFVWKCAQDSIVSVDLSNNGKYAAVSVIGAREGEIYSKIYIFDFDYAEPVSEFEYFGTAIIEVRFVSNNNVVAIGDHLISFIKGLDKKEDKSYDASTLSAYTFDEDGNTILVLSEYGSTNSEKLTRYNSSFSVDFEKKYTSNVKYVYASGSKVSVLLDDKAIVYRGNGDVYKELEADSTSISLFNLGNNTYIYNIGNIVKGTEVKER